MIRKRSREGRRIRRICKLMDRLVQLDADLDRKRKNMRAAELLANFLESSTHELVERAVRLEAELIAARAAGDAARVAELEAGKVQLDAEIQAFQRLGEKVSSRTNSPDFTLDDVQNILTEMTN